MKGMILLTLFGRTARSLLSQLTASIILLLILDVPVRVKSQCPTECTGQSIKTVNVTTGECISCFPCPQCIAGYTTSSVPCGTTVPYGTKINCVLIPPDPVAVSKASTQTRHLTSTPPLAITTSSRQLIATPVTSVVHSVVVPTTSSSAPAGSSIKESEGSEGSETTKKTMGEKVLPSEEYSKWKKHTVIYILCAICLLITSVAIAWRISRKKRCRIPTILRRAENPDGPYTSPVQPRRSYTSHSQDNETCNIDLATNSVAFSRHKDHDTSEMRHDKQKIQPGAALASPDGNVIPSNLGATTVLQPHTPPLSWPQALMDNERNGPITDGMEQGRPVSWSTLTQKEKYNIKVLEMPYPVLYSICLTLDILIPDGNDVRMLAHKLGISVRELARLKQALVNTQNLDNFNSITRVVLGMKLPSGTVGDFVDIMKDIGRDDIVSEINN